MMEQRWTPVKEYAREVASGSNDATGHNVVIDRRLEMEKNEMLKEFNYDQDLRKGDIMLDQVQHFMTNAVLKQRGKRL